MKLYAKKSLGQHFLNSKHVLKQIIDAADIKKGETVLEIGPGTGVLTEALLETGAKVISIEKDGRAIELLRIKFEVASQSGRLKVIEGDILEENFTAIDQNSKEISTNNKDESVLENGKYSITANIPYYITGAILEKFLEHEPRPNKMVLLVQKEVAERIVTKDAKESILSISVKAFGTPELVAFVPRGAFTPPPTVDSAILSISNISDRHFIEKNVDIPKFFAVLKAGFAHKRKYLIRNLEAIIEKDKLTKGWESQKFDTKVRAEDVSLDQWLEISRM